MKTKSVLIIRWGAYGDQIHMSNVIRAFDELGYFIGASYNYKGVQIHADNPRIDRHYPYDPTEQSQLKASNADPAHFYNIIKQLSQGYNKVINLQGSLEGALIEDEQSYKYFMPLSWRRAKNTHTCYYDQSMLWAGIRDPKFMGRTGEIFFTREEHAHVGNYMKDFQDRYIIIWALRGSMYQKAVYPLAEETISRFCEKHPETVVFTTGDQFCTQFEFDHPNVVHLSGKFPFRQVLLMSKYSDLVVTPETGLGIGAGAFSTPKIMLLTAASLTNIVGNDKNDFSMQSNAWCSPCTRAIYNTNSCPKLGKTIPVDKGTAAYITTTGKKVPERVELPLCVGFSIDEILERMDYVHALKIPRTNYNPTIKDEVYM